MALIKFSDEEKKLIVGRIQAYFREELHQELGGFDAEFLFDSIRLIAMSVDAGRSAACWRHTVCCIFYIFS